MVDYIPALAGGGGGLTLQDVIEDRLYEIVRSMFGDMWGMRLRSMLKAGAKVGVVMGDPVVDVCGTGYVCTAKRRGRSYLFTLDGTNATASAWAWAIVAPLPSNFSELLLISAMSDPTTRDVAMSLYDSATDSNTVIAHIYPGLSSADFRLHVGGAIVSESVDLQVNVLYPFILYTNLGRHELQRQGGSKLVLYGEVNADRIRLGCKVDYGNVATCFYDYIILVYL